jgi:heme exporter protein D
MNWGSAAEFFAMGGHGPFIWGSYAVTALLMLAEPVLAARRHARARRALAVSHLERPEED